MGCSVPSGRERPGHGADGRPPHSAARVATLACVSEDTTTGRTTTHPDGVERPRRVAVAAVLSAVQGLVAAGLGVFMLLLSTSGGADNLLQAVTGAVTVLALAALPLAAGHGLWRLRRWSRGPAVIVQLLLLPVVWTLGGSGGLWPVAAVALAGSALAVLACLVNPTATQALGIGPGEDAGAGGAGQSAGPRKG